jgi:hypothetical protein
MISWRKSWLSNWSKKKLTDNARADISNFMRPAAIKTSHFVRNFRPGPPAARGFKFFVDFPA